MQKLFLFTFLIISSLVFSQDTYVLEIMLNETIKEAGVTGKGVETVLYQKIDVKEAPREFTIRYHKIIPLEESYNLPNPRFQNKNGKLYKENCILTLMYHLEGIE